MCESERASYHPCARGRSDHYKRRGAGASLSPADDEIGEGKEGFSIIHSGQRERRKRNERSGPILARTAATALAEK